MNVRRKIKFYTQSLVQANCQLLKEAAEATRQKRSAKKIGIDFRKAMSLGLFVTAPPGVELRSDITNLEILARMVALNHCQCLTS